MIKRRNLLALTMALAMVLSGCSNEPSKTPFKLDMMFLSKPKIVLAVEEKLKNSTEDSIKAFAKSVNDMSKGDMTVEVMYCLDPMAELNNRTADMAYGSTKSLSKYSSLFEMLESPFYFRNYSHMTMTLNSQSFTDMVKADLVTNLKSQLLATTFSDASMILSSKDYIEDINSMKKLNITLRDNEDDNDIFKAMEANVKVATEEEMIADFNSGDTKVIECRISKLSEVKKPLDEDFFYITETWHNIELEWLLVSSDYMDTQNSHQKAIIIDAAASFVATQDKYKLDKYDEELDRLIVNGGEVTRYAPDQIRRKAKEVIVAKKNADKANNWNMDIYDNVQSIIR